MIDIQSVLDRKLDSVEKHLQNAIFERDHSATPMESHSDKSRQLAEQMIDSLNDEKKRLVGLERNIKNFTPTLFALTTPIGNKQYALVPEGLGGELIGEITLISQESPLGRKLKESKKGEKFSLNGKEFTILSKD